MGEEMIEYGALSLVTRMLLVPGATLDRQARSGTREVGWLKRPFGVCLLCSATIGALHAQTFKTLHSFDNADGAGPLTLVQGTNGNLYGITVGGDNANAGTVFKITLGGTLTTVHDFCPQGGCPDGDYPTGLIQAPNGNLYGTTLHGGANDAGAGTVFEITSNGTLTTLYSFFAQGFQDGALPWGGVVRGADGNFYGTTSGDGANGGGTVFRVTPSGTLTTLYSFCSQSGCTDGAEPLAGLVQAIDGNLYGTTFTDGPMGGGTVFRITRSGTLTTLYGFCSQSGCTDGENPDASLIQATDGNLYGTTSSGGAGGDGTVFRIAPSGGLTTLHSFGGADGASPEAGLIQATDGNFYGTTYEGGALIGGSWGTVFKITPSGTLTTLHNFGWTDGALPYAALVQDTDGNLYGTTLEGGSFCSNCSGYGTVFSLSVGLGPFVTTLPTSGKVGSAVKILGTNLTGATSVNFNGTPAMFTLISRSLITTTVPTGATTGTVQVVTPSGTLSSNVPFRVP
jgi:uncharacterized repeat protein (TIGR03803 family)